MRDHCVGDVQFKVLESNRKKKVLLEGSIYKISNCIVCFHLTIGFRNERTMRMSFISLRTKEDAKEVLTVLSTLGKLES